MQNMPTFQTLISMGDNLLSNYDFEKGLSLISKHVTDATSAARCSIFIYEKKSDELWTILSTGIEKIHVPSEQGIVGYVFRTKHSIIENNVTKNTNFLSDIDKQSGYVTRNIIACPMFNAKQEIIGVLELLNKDDGFTEEDLNYLNVFSSYLASLIELAPFYLKENAEA